MSHIEERKGNGVGEKISRDEKITGERTRAEMDRKLYILLILYLCLHTGFCFKRNAYAFQENQLLMQNWQDKLAEKRHYENLENTKRYLDIQDKSLQSRSNLMLYIEERDRKVQRYLEEMNYKKV